MDLSISIFLSLVLDKGFPRIVNWGERLKVYLYFQAQDMHCMHYKEIDHIILQGRKRAYCNLLAHTKSTTSGDCFCSKDSFCLSFSKQQILLLFLMLSFFFSCWSLFNIVQHLLGQRINFAFQLMC